MSVQLILFDLDGTLLDTAPDLGAALNAQRAEHKLPPLPQENIRPVVSHGSPALLKLGFGLAPEDGHYTEMRTRLLAIYSERLTRETRFFPGMEAVLAELARQHLAWGIVTNKPGFLTRPLLNAFNLQQQTACVVSGDTTARRKPHPDQLLHACDVCKVRPDAAIYVGDAERDVQAAQAAGMRTLVALYGYIGVEEQPQNWGADGLLEAPTDLIDWLQQQTTNRSEGAHA